MHPELENLEQQYLHLVAELQAGHISEPDAKAILSNMNVFDGEGAMWSINPYSGQFERGFPGGPMVEADPGFFVPVSAPGLGGQPFGGQPLGGQPFGGQPFGGPSARGPVGPVGGFGGPMPGQVGPPAGSMPGQVGPAGPFGAAMPASAAGSPAKRVKAPKLPDAGAALGRLSGLARGRGRTIGVVVVALLLLGGLWSARPGSSDPQTPSTSETFGSTPADRSTVPESTPASTAASTTVPAVQFTPEQVQALVMVLAGGSSDQVNAFVAFESVPELRAQMLDVLGASRAGLTLVAGDAVAVDASTTQIALAARVAGADAAAVRTWTLTLRLFDGGVWRIVAAAPQ